jgi:hypothetical protein
MSVHSEGEGEVQQRVSRAYSWTWGPYGRSQTLAPVRGQPGFSNTPPPSRSLGRTNRLLSFIRHGPHWKRCVQQSSTVACVFVIAVTFLPIRCLATIGGFLPIRCLETVRGFLPSRCLTTIRKYTYRHRLMGGIFILLSLFWKKYSRLMRSRCCSCVCVCVCVFVSPPLTFERLNQSLWNLFQNKVTKNKEMQSTEPIIQNIWGEGLSGFWDFLDFGSLTKKIIAHVNSTIMDIC